MTILWLLVIFIVIFPAIDVGIRLINNNLQGYDRFYLGMVLVIYVIDRLRYVIGEKL